MASIIQMPGKVKRPPVDLYPHLHFEPYTFVQFPEWVDAPEGWQASGDETVEKVGEDRMRVLVHDEEEKRRVLEGGAVKSGEVDERTGLLALAEQKGIAVDKRWSLDTLRAKVA